VRDQNTGPAADLAGAFDEHRPALLRHCYRMLGAFADAEDVVQDVLLRAWRSRDTYAGDAPIGHWLMRIATNTCLNALNRRVPRRLPQLEREATPAWTGSEELQASVWVTPAPDARLFPDPAGAAEAREQVALAFIALLQRLPPKQRAALLLKDVVGWSAEDTAAALELSVPAVSSALHRARETMAAHRRAPADEPSPEVLAAYVRSWETRDLDGLVALLREEVIFAMPPHAIWLRGRDAVRGFLQSPRFSAFWARGLRATPTRASGLPALAWYSGGDEDGEPRLHSIHVMRFEGGALAEAINFIGPHYLRGFDLPLTLRRPV
jgi:RNA polymerase sigma-70 factor (ECF subfamily)